jgi:hypothetical protein
MKALEIIWVPVEQPEPPRVENRIQLPNPADEDRWYRPPVKDELPKPSDRGVFIIEF